MVSLTVCSNYIQTLTVLPISIAVLCAISLVGISLELIIQVNNLTKQYHRTNHPAAI